MSRLPRPNIPIEIRCRVALRQLGEMFPEAALDAWRHDRTVASEHRKLGLGKMLESLLIRLARLLGCEVSDLRLDHDPALENREKFVEMPLGNRVWVAAVPKGAKVLRYRPDANDPEHLFYRPHGAQFAGSHDVKTRVRGDHGQLSDNALAKKERKRLRKLDPKRRRTKIANHKNPWPKGRKIQNRRGRR